MQDKERVAPNRYRWLLPVVGLVAATVGGWAVAILGLILSRWLRPFDVAARIGYALCWLTLTVIPAVWIAGSGYWEWSWQRVGPPAGYLLTVAAWWLLRPKLFRLPSAHRAAALGVSLLGAVLTAPGYMGLTVVAPMPYVLAAIGYGSVVPPRRRWLPGDAVGRRGVDDRDLVRRPPRGVLALAQEDRRRTALTPAVEAGAGSSFRRTRT
jgi:hypothetical protein